MMNRATIVRPSRWRGWTEIEGLRDAPNRRASLLTAPGARHRSSDAGWGTRRTLQTTTRLRYMLPVQMKSRDSRSKISRREIGPPALNLCAWDVDSA